MTSRGDSSGTLNIGLLTSLGYNVGDDFIREGVRAILDRADVSYYPLYVNKVDAASLHERREDEALVVSDKFWNADVFIQCGAPVYWHLAQGLATSVTAEWYDWIWRARILDDARADGPTFLNLGAGSCFPWDDQEGRAFLEDASCVRFTREAAARAALTTVRDRVASSLLTTLGVDHALLPCPAFLAGARHQPRRPSGEYVAINLMPLGGHWDFEGDFDADQWRVDALRLVARLRQLGPVVFVAHDATEALFLSSLGTAIDPVFQSPDWRAYLDVYAGARLVVANRVHGAVCAAGFGVPAVVVGSDTRAFIGEPLALPVLRIGHTPVDEIVATAHRLVDDHQEHRERLLKLRDETIDQYACLVRRVLPGRTKGRALQLNEPLARAALGSVEELSSNPFAGFMAAVNHFASTHGLRVFTDWSKVWEYPWLWREALGRESWTGRRLVDVGSEISPMPWLIASLGAEVTLVERDPQWVPIWERLRETLHVRVSWHVADGERLPLENDSADVVSSFSVIEHQGDKTLAVDEMVRVLRPGGLLAMSFDVCEPSQGMSFPEENGQALTLNEFEQLVWRHPALETRTDPNWNLADVKPFLGWHLGSAPHHNYVVAAAVFRRTTAAVRWTFAGGWHGEEGRPPVEWRWCDGAGTIEVWVHRSGDYSIVADIAAFREADEIVLSIDGRETLSVGAGREFLPLLRLSFELAAGRHAFRLTNRRGGGHAPGDPRVIAFAVRGFCIAVGA